MRSCWQGLRHVLLRCAVLAPALTLSSPLWAACGGSAEVGSKFREAATLCSDAPRSQNPTSPSEAPYIIVEEPAATAPGPVAISMAGHSAAASVRREAARRPGRPIDTLIREVAADYRIAPGLLAAIVQAESAGRSTAVSHKGALGLMQVMPGTARQLGVRDPSRLLVDDRLSLRTGARYLKQMQARFGNNVPLVLAAYNAGPGAVTRYGHKVPPYRETQDYVRKIMKAYRAR